MKFHIIHDWNKWSDPIDTAHSYKKSAKQRMQDLRASSSKAAPSTVQSLVWRRYAN